MGPAQQILRGATGVLSWQPAGADGEPVDPGVVTVAVADSAGDPVVTGPVTGTGTEPRTATIGPVLTLDMVTALWSHLSAPRATTLAEIVGGYWFTLAQAIADDEKLADPGRYPLDRFTAVRREVEDEFEGYTGQAWVPRFAVETVSVTGGEVLVLPHVAIRTVRSITDPDGNPVDLDGIDVEPWGVLRGRWWTGTYRVAYEHGHDSPPADLRRAAVTRLRHRLNAFRSGIPDRATSVSTEQGQTFALATPGLRGFVTGIPDVDVVLERYRFVRTGVA